MNQSRQPYTAVGQCIYCGRKSPEVVLTKEHIIAQGLEGDLVLPEASCGSGNISGLESCATITGRFEQSYMRGAYGSLRTYLGVQGVRRKKDRKQTIPLRLTRMGEDSPSEAYEVNPATHPFWAVFCEFEPPYALSGETGDGTYSARIVKLASDDNIIPHIGKYVTIEGIHTDTYTRRILAKIAHSYAIAEYGLNVFYPTLTHVILNRQYGDERDDHNYYVGGRPEANPYPTSNLHELSLCSQRIGNSFLILCQIRLFSNVHNTPTYEIVAGSHWNSTLSPRCATIQQRAIPPWLTEERK